MAQNATNGINETRLTITNVIRENPIPTALLGVSLGWLFWSARQQRTFAEPAAGFDATESVSERTDKIVDQVKETGDGLGKRAQNVAGKVAEGTRNGTRRVQEQFFESPLAIGTATLAAGLAAGMVVPATRRESEWVGDVRDRLVDRVRNVAP